ncbi:MAG: hypothetical protein KAS48_06660 [Gammaproteobacteria bacterium]|nr:hypothetical protein [Gammaproteobacteria bacterium]
MGGDNYPSQSPDKGRKCFMPYFIARGIIVIGLLLVAGVGASGCSPADRYKVLTFFFTGVPEPGSELEKDDETGKILAAKVRARKKRNIFFQEPKFYIHGPYGASECEKCHSADSARQFRVGGGVKKESTTRSKSRKFGPRLAYPLEKLCITCHSEKSDSFAKSLHLSVHEPVATGKCTECHDPHKAARQYMLRGKDSIDLCTKACHSIDELLKTAVHRKNKEEDCLDCHNAHVGKTAQLLRSEFDEWSQFDGRD